MPVPLIVVEIPTSDVGRADVSVLLESCSAALKPGRCEVRQEGATAPATAVAVLAWQDAERSTAVIEVGRRETSGDSWLREELRFEPEDAVAERFRAVGLTVAALCRELAAPDDALRANRAGSEAKGKSRASTPASPTKPPDDSSAVGASAFPISIAAGVILTTDPTFEVPRGGVFAGLYWSPLKVPLSLLASTRVAIAAPANTTVTWLALGVGTGWLWDLDQFAIRGRVEPIAERVAATAEDSEGVSQTQSHWIGGVRLGLDGIWTGGDWWALAASIEASQLASVTVINFHGEPVARVPAFSLAAGLSLEIRVPTAR